MAIQNECFNFCDTALQVSDLLELAPDYFSLLSSKNSEVRGQALKFIEKGAASIPLEKLRDLGGQVLPELVKLINDISPQVRENAVPCLAIFLKRLGQEFMGPFLKDVKQ